MRRIDSKDVTGIVRRALGYVDNRLVEHGERVAYIVYRMLKQQGGYEDIEIRNFCFLAMLHDIGAYKTEEIDNLIQFETGDVWSHSVYGYLFIKYLSPLSELAQAVLYHHCDYAWLLEQEGIEITDRDITLAQMISIADRMDIYQSSGGSREEQAVLSEYRGKKFSPEIIDLFCDSKKSRGFREKGYLKELVDVMSKQPFTGKELDDILSMLVSAIDFRSHHTVVHSIVTTSISESLGTGLGLGGDELEEIHYGALLHDLGKIGVPVKILEYPGRLNNHDMEIMRSHVDITEQILCGEVEENVTNIALRHHEKLDGSGYPRGLSDGEMTLGEKIVAVADLISALCGKRSYKEAFSKEKTIEIMKQQAKAGCLQKKVVEYAVIHYDEIIDYTNRICEPVLRIYDDINEEYRKMMRNIQKSMAEPALS